jgi:hypothetical protein
MPRALPSGSGGVPVWAWVSGGAGIALGGVGIGFFVTQIGAQQDQINACKAPGPACNAANTTLTRDFGLGLGFAIAGGAGIVAGVLGIATAPRASKGVARGAHWTPWLAGRAGGVAAGGEF